MTEAGRSAAGRASVVTLLGAMLNAGLAFVVAGIVSNSLGAARTGHFFQGVALFTVTAAAVSLGADTAMVRTASRLQALGRQGQVWRVMVEALAVSVSFSAITALAAWWFAAPLAAFISGPEQQHGLTEVIRALAPFLPAAPLLAILLGTSRGLGQIYPYTLVQNAVVPLARVASVLLVATLALGLVGFVSAWAASLVLGGVIACALMVNQYRRTLDSAEERSGRPRPKEFWGFALPRGAAALVERALEWADVLIVLALAGPAAGGVYAIVRRLASAGGLLESTMRIVTGPMLSRAFAREDRQEVAALFREGSALLLLVSGPLYVTLMVFGAPILSLFGSEFTVGRGALAVIALVFLAEIACGMLQSVLLMGGKSHWQLQNKVVQLAILCVTSIALVPRLGLTGAALAWGCGAAANVILSARQVGSLAQTRPSLRIALLPAAVVGLTFGVVPLLVISVTGLTVQSLLVALPCSAALYGLLCYLLRERLSLAAFWERS